VGGCEHRAANVLPTERINRPRRVARKGLNMFTHYYNGMYINGYTNKPECRVSDDYNTFAGRVFKSYRAAQIAITKARAAGVAASR